MALTTREVARVYESLDIDPPPGSPEYDELEFLSVLIEGQALVLRERLHIPLDLLIR